MKKICLLPDPAIRHFEYDQDLMPPGAYAQSMHPCPAAIDPQLSIYVAAENPPCPGQIPVITLAQQRTFSRPTPSEDRKK